MKHTRANKNIFETKIKQIMAGYKANYNRNINNARGESERKALIAARDKWIAKKQAEVIANIQHELVSAFNWLENYKNN